MAEIEAFPLYWPPGWPRAAHCERSRFDQTPGYARRNLVWEVQRLGGSRVIISTNVPLRRDGFPYADGKPVDGNHGVAVWFTLNGDQQCIPCDRWDRVMDNMHAVELSIAALRGLERWGAQAMVKAAFKGFAQLPAPGANHWRNILGPNVETVGEVEDRYRELARVRHPDTGGSESAMADLNRARDQAREELGHG